jgi:hypothetical protein
MLLILCPEGVGVRLADDLPGTGSKPCWLGVSEEPHPLISGLLRSPSSASQTPTPSGQNQKRD